MTEQQDTDTTLFRDSVESALDAFCMGEPDWRTRPDAEKLMERMSEAMVMNMTYMLAREQRMLQMERERCARLAESDPEIAARIRKPDNQVMTQ
jgi:hypothetical protein